MWPESPPQHPRPKETLSNHRLLCFFRAEPLTLDVEYTEVEVTSPEPHRGNAIPRGSDPPHFAVCLSVCRCWTGLCCDPGTRVQSPLSLRREVASRQAG